MQEAVEAYLSERYWQEPPLLTRIRDDIAKSTTPIEVPAETAKFLQMMVRTVGARRILEVGTLFGYSAICMAQAMPDGGHLDTVELSNFHADRAGQWIREAGLDSVIEIHRGTSREVIPTLSGTYDLAFLDGEKAEYVNDAENAFKLLRPGGVLLADNLIHKGAIVDPDEQSAMVNGIRAFHDYLATKSGIMATVLPVGDGVAFAIKLSVDMT